MVVVSLCGLINFWVGEIASLTVFMAGRIVGGRVISALNPLDTFSGVDDAERKDMGLLTYLMGRSRTRLFITSTQTPINERSDLK